MYNASFIRIVFIGNNFMNMRFRNHKKSVRLTFIKLAFYKKTLSAVYVVIYFIMAMKMRNRYKLIDIYTVLYRYSQPVRTKNLTFFV